MPLTVVVKSAADLPSVDAKGSSDPLAVLTFQDNKKKTKVINRTLDPYWNEEFVWTLAAPPQPTEVLQIQVYDFNRTAKNELLGHTEVSLRDVMTKKQYNPTLTLQGKEGEILQSTITLQITYNDPTTEKRQGPHDIQGIISKIPKKRDVLQLLHPISYKWYEIAISLKIDDRRCQALRLSNTMPNIQKLSEVIQIWLDNFDSTTWGVLIATIEGPPIQNRRVAYEIREYLSKPEVYERYADAPSFPTPNARAYTDAIQLDHNFLRKAIKKGGSVKASISKVLVQGPARVGKTSTKCLVLGHPYKSIVSTGAVERPHVAVGDFSITQFGQASKNTWELVNDDRTIEMFANDIKALLLEDDDDIPFSKETSPQLPDVDVDSSSDSSTDLQAIEESDDAAKELSEILSKASTRADKLTLYKDWLYFIDSGGQIQFQQILQAFIPCASILMLVISLADDLSSQSSAELQCEDEKKYIVSEHSLSTETLLKRLISMVNFSNQHEDLTSGDNHLSAAIKPPEKLKVIAIATHRDKYDELLMKGEITETIDDKEKRLKQIFQSVEGNLSYQNPFTGNILSEVDGRKASHDQRITDDPVINDIRRELSKQAFNVEIPLSWYAYEILLREKARDSCGVLTIEECTTSGIELGLEEGEITSALKFLYLLNSILYYPEKVTKLVFVDPFSLIQVINELMVLICKARSGVDVGRGTLALRDVAKFGIISGDVFSHEDHLKMFATMSSKYSDFKSHLFNIFTHLLIAKKLPGNKPPNDKYFMPALLPLTNPLKAIPFESPTNSPLLFYFKNGAPVGLFCAMIVNLLSSEDYITDDDDNGLYNDFSWELDTKSTPKMYSNAIILRNYDLLGRVGLVESSDWFEIHCERREDQAEVKEAIENAIKETKKRRNIGKGMKLDIAFFCPCGKQPRHLAILNQRYRELYCNLPHSGHDCNVVDIKDSPQMSWITSLKSNPGKRPELRHLVQLLAPISSRWDLLGGQLGVEEDFIEGLKNCEKTPKTKLTEVLQKWIDTKPTPVTWEKVIEVVKGPVVQKVDVAVTIQESLRHIRIEQRQVKRQRDKDTGCSNEAELIDEDMSDIPQLHDKPDKVEVLTKLVCIHSSWRGIGLDLGVSYNDLQSLAESNLPNKTKLDHVLQKWIEMDGQATPVTWKVILDVVKGPLVQNKAVAMEIYQSLKHQDAEQQNTSKLNANKAFLFLHKCGFKSSQWESLAPLLHVPLDDRKKLLSSYEVNKNHDWVLEETLNCWITCHSSQPTLDELTRAVEECGEKNVATIMQRELKGESGDDDQESFHLISQKNLIIAATCISVVLIAVMVGRSYFSKKVGRSCLRKHK